MRHRYLSSLLSLTLFAALATPVAAQDPESAEGIMKRVLARDAFGWDGAETRMRMILTDKNNKVRERVMESLRRRKGNLQQSVIRFRAPQDVAGTAFLTVERDKGETEQHIYLPRLKRTRRLVGREREGSFMGSDFTYADMERRDTRQSSHVRKPDEDMGGTSVYVIESTPTKGSGSSYGKIISWIRKDNLLPMRIKFFDTKGKIQKTFYARRIKNIDGQAVIWESLMKNQQTGHSTKMVLDDLRPRKNIPDSAFTPTALEHG